MYYKEQIIALFAIGFLSLPAFAAPMPAEARAVKLNEIGEVVDVAGNVVNDVVNVADNIHNAWEEWKSHVKRDVDVDARGVKTDKLNSIAGNVNTAGNIVNGVVNEASQIHSDWEEWTGHKRDVDVEARKISGSAVENIVKTAGGIASDVWNTAENVENAFEQWKSSAKRGVKTDKFNQVAGNFNTAANVANDVANVANDVHNDFKQWFE